MINRVSYGNAHIGESEEGVRRDLNLGELGSLRKMTGLSPRGEKKTPGGAT